MTDFVKRTWCEINLEHIQYNINLIQKTAQKEVIAVVKADAYGHGDKYVCRELAKAGVKWFAVSGISEALVLRKEGFRQNILILGYTPPDYAEVLSDNNITQAVYDLDYALALDQALRETGKTVNIHVKVDTGMHRIGFEQSDAHSAAREIVKVAALPSFRTTGIFTHFCHSDSFDLSAICYTKEQMHRLDTVIRELKACGVSFEMVHAQNSAGIICYPDDAYNYVRAGIILYGLAPSDELEHMIAVKPAMSWKSIVTMVKTVQPGSAISYGRTYTAEKEMRLATVAIGYADGYSRLFSSKADVLIHGKRCRITGRVCMDQMMVDITDVPDVQIGDEVTLFGTDGEETISADELARIAGTINYEIVCNVGRRVPRIYLKDGKPVGVEDYLLG